MAIRFTRALGRPHIWALLLAAVAPGTYAQTPIFSLYGTNENQDFGRSVASLGDVDTDGHPDLAVALPGVDRVHIYSGALGTELTFLYVGSQSGIEVAGPGDLNGDGYPDLLAGQPGVFGHGQASIFSGKTWDTLYGVNGSPNLGYWFGWAMDGVGDVDLDGIADFIVGDHGEDFVVSDQGSVRVYSGDTGAKLATVLGKPMLAQRFGYSVSATGDIDGDGIPDWVAGTDEFDGPTTAYVRVYSGADTSQIHHFDGPDQTPNYGNSVAGPGDVDADGVPDILIGDWWNDAAGQNHGAAHLYSGGTGELLNTFYGDDINHYFGYSVSDTGDLDQDGRPEFLVTARPTAFSPSGSGPGYARVFTGVEGSILYTLVSGYFSSTDWFGDRAIAAGDVNGDGTPDLAVTAPLYQGLTPWGMLRVFSGKPLSLSSDGQLFSVSAPGLVNLRLNAGESHAGELYLLAGTLSGTAPGIPIDAVVVPLNADAYLLHTVASPNQPPLSGSLGFLSASGVALAQFSLPGGSSYPSLVGKSAHHAFALLGPGGVDFASNAVPLTFSP